MTDTKGFLEEVNIEHFQGHEFVNLNFHPGLNVIKGTSHKGKSSIVRALEWAFFNRPRGEGFKSHFSEEDDQVSVESIFSDGEWILRRKNKDFNGYEIENYDPLAAIKTDVPDEIKKITQINEINFQKQNAPYFMIGETPGAAGKKLNEFVGLTIIDEVRNKINKKVGELVTRLKINAEEIKNTKENLENYGHVNEAEILVKKIDQSKLRLEKLIQRHNNINHIRVSLDELYNLIDGRIDWLKVEPKYTKLKEQLDLLNEKKSKYHRLSTDIKRIKNIRHDINETKDWLKVESTYIKLEKERSKFDIQRFKRDKIKNICSDIHEHKKHAETLSQFLEMTLERQSELEKKLNYCQTCGAARKHWRR